MTTSSKLKLAELATSIVRCFPSLNVVEQRLSLELKNEAQYGDVLQ